MHVLWDFMSSSYQKTFGFGNVVFQHGGCRLEKIFTFIVTNIKKEQFQQK